jgi:hypothetical protein
MKSVSTLLFTALCCVVSQQLFAQAPGFSGNTLVGNQSTGAFYITSANNSTSGSYIEMFPNSASAAPGTIGYVAGYNVNRTNSPSHIFWIPTGPSSYSPTLIIQQDGKVNIGTRLPTSQTNYKLAVEGRLVAQSLYVTNPTTWADFVFEPKYTPMALPALETYLLKNKHLPYIPSTKEVEKSGYNVAEMDAKLLQTVEELTLQVIALNKQNMRLESEMIALRKQIGKKVGSKLSSGAHK